MLSLSLLHTMPHIMKVCISFILHRGLAVLAKSVTPSRIAENLKSVDVKLDAEDMKKLREVQIILLSGRSFNH